MSELVRRGAGVPQKPEVSIVILVQDRVDLLSRCLESLARLDAAPRHEVVVVANGAPASALAPLLQHPGLVVVPSPVNLGFAAGCNWGVRFTRGQRLVLLNDDTEVEPGWLRNLVDLGESEVNIGAVGSRLLNADGSLQEAGSILWQDGGTHQVRDRLPAEARACDRVRDVDYCSACALLVKRQAWDAVGGFDEAYFPAYHEDVDLCLSLRARGYRTIYAPGARVRHHRAASMSAELRAFAAARNGRLFAAKWAETLTDFEPRPMRGHVDGAVAAALRRTEGRRLPPLGSETGQVRRVSAPPTHVEALQTQVRALQAAQRLCDDHIAWLVGGGKRRRQQQARRAWLRRLVLRLPAGRRATVWVSRHLGGG